MRLSRKILLGASVIVVLVNAVVLQLVGWRYEAELRQELTESARSYYKLIVLVRAWVAHNDGVFVRQRPGTEANPYLDSPVLYSAAGDTLVWRNPAMVTRELSQLSEAMGKRVQFRVTSLDPVNPANAPDAFEAEALRAVRERDTSRITPLGESTGYEEVEGNRHFRYFAPIFTEESCLSCHARQGYRQGDVRGGISIRIPLEQFQRAAVQRHVLIAGGSLLASAVVSLLLFLFIRRSVVWPLRRLEDAAAEIGRGNFDTPVLADSQDEIGDVGRAMARMQEAIRVAVERQVEREKMYALGEMSAGIAHEIRNPLFAIRNDLDYLQRYTAPDERQAEVYAAMDQGLRRIGTTVNAVLGYARPHRPEHGRHELGAVIDGCLALLRKQLADRQASVDVDIAPTVPAVEMDAHQVEQVLVNLLTNAARSKPEGGVRIRIRAMQVAEDGVEIEVADDGCGIPPGDLGRIFDPFYTRSADGTGLGLTIVRRIIEQHQGTIRVESEIGLGTTFRIRLPVEQAQVVPA